MVVFVDIDGTICSHTDGQYDKARPWPEAIEKINQRYRDGETIIYWTARGTTTGKDWRPLTEKQLCEWGAMYHELRFGKPYYDLMICDRTQNKA